MIAVQSHTGDGSRDSFWWGYKLIRVVDAGFAGKKRQLGVEVILILIYSKAEGFREIDSIIEYGRRAKSNGVIPYLVGHCAGARMHSVRREVKRLATKTCGRRKRCISQLGSPAHNLGRPSERCRKAMAAQVSRCQGVKVSSCQVGERVDICTEGASGIKDARSDHLLADAASSISLRRYLTRPDRACLPAIRPLFLVVSRNRIIIVCLLACHYTVPWQASLFAVPAASRCAPMQPSDRHYAVLGITSHLPRFLDIDRVTLGMIQIVSSIRVGSP